MACLFHILLAFLLFKVLGLAFGQGLLFPTSQAAVVFFFFHWRKREIIKNKKIRKRSDFAGFQSPEVRENLSTNHQIYILGFPSVAQQYRRMIKDL
jgi:hypothetical protein